MSDTPRTDAFTDRTWRCLQGGEIVCDYLHKSLSEQLELELHAETVKHALAFQKLEADLQHERETTAKMLKLARIHLNELRRKSSAKRALDCADIFEGQLNAKILSSNADVDLPDTAAQDSASKSNSSAVSG